MLQTGFTYIRQETRLGMKKKRRVLSAWIMALVLSAAGLGCTATAGEVMDYSENALNYVEGSMDISQGIPDDALGVLVRIRQNGVLRVATEPYFPPQEYIDPNLEGQEKYQGADMELARLIAEKMGVELQIVEMDFADVLPSVSEDQCDLAISALAFTPGRAAANEMSKGYYFSDIPKCSVLIRKEDVDEITSIEDLADKTMIAQQGSLQETMMICNITKYQEFRRVPSIQMVYDAVQDGTADAAAVDAETALEYIRHDPDCGLTLAPGIEFLLEEQYQGDRIAAKKGEIQLMFFVNGVIDEVMQKDLYTQWIEEARAKAHELGLWGE